MYWSYFHSMQIQHTRVLLCQALPRFLYMSALSTTMLMLLLTGTLRPPAPPPGSQRYH
jgi:hypothetical protein